MKRRKAGELRPRVAIGLTPGHLKEEISHWRGDKDPNQPESRWHDFSFQRSCQKTRRMYVEDRVEMKGARSVLRKSSGGEETTTRNTARYSLQ